MKPEIRRGELARAKRLATMVARAVHENWTGWAVQQARLELVRGLVLRFRELKLRPRDLDTPNGYEAIVLIGAALSPQEWRTYSADRSNLGRMWNWIIHRAVAEVQTNKIHERRVRRLDLHRPGVQP